MVAKHSERGRWGRKKSGEIKIGWVDENGMLNDAKIAIEMSHLETLSAAHDLE